ncbi:MAG: ornithine carbamoyltransferase [Candidatus Thermoplasmatota archaeon]|jgi:ornithine carbamoyltransferase|nr:ornithine carbamoyltransferase [Candidatus Thermoplasmatota archaeon]MDP7264850.1 ornithine carbamoyltransferase [Candidatus Thermoplasmatota archaeon]
MVKHLISILDVEDKIRDLLDLALEIKEKTRIGERYAPMEGQTLGMIFEKPSTRTRLSFEVGAVQLGAQAIYMSRNDLQMGRGETISDTSRVMSRYLDIIMYRAFDHCNVIKLAENSTVPVINALDDLEHPCQALADLLTIYEKKIRFEDLKLAYLGDGNNVCNSLLLASAAVGLDISIATPPNHGPNEKIIKEAMRMAERTHAEINIINSPREAIMNADIIYTDTWVSMGDESETCDRISTFTPYQVNGDMAALADEEYIFMHCLPAHRGQEVTDSVMDSNNSVVFDQAENRLHIQKAIMVYLLGLVDL